MINKAIYFSGVEAILFVLLPSNADRTSKDQEISERFSKYDTRKDGKLTLVEAKRCIYASMSVSIESTLKKLANS